MCSTLKRHRKTIAIALLAAGALVGCQANVPPSMSKVNNTPLPIDDAMQRRDWDRSVAYYPNGDTVGGGTGYMFQTHETVTDPYRRVVDPAVSSMNMVLLPIGVFVNTPFKPQVAQGEMLPPTYTAQPVLPAGAD